MQSISTPLIVIPLYNHAATITAVTNGIFKHADDFFQNSDVTWCINVLIVNDGSTDNAAQQLAALKATFGERLNILNQPQHIGKGKAILAASAWAWEQGYSHIITIDADGQHDPADLPRFFEAIQTHPKHIIVGSRNFDTPNVPAASRFGRSFSAFWMRVQTGHSAPDMQSGYRAYPVSILQTLSFYESRYSFEIEVIVKSIWAGFSVLGIPVSVYYQPGKERVSHFKKVADNVRISILNTRLTIRALIPVPFRTHHYDENDKISALSPVKSLTKLLRDDNTPYKLAISTFVAIIISMLPILGFQSILILLCVGWFGLSRLWTLAVAHLCWPPLVPALCIEAGYYLRHGVFLTEISLQTLGYEIFQRLWEWLLGALVFGPVLAAFVGGVVYIVAYGLKNGLKDAKEYAPPQ